MRLDDLKALILQSVADYTVDQMVYNQSIHNIISLISAVTVTWIVTTDKIFSK